MSGDRLIPFPESRAEHDVLAEIAEGAQGGRRECSRIQPLRAKGDGRAARRALCSRINIRQHLVGKLQRTRHASESGGRVRVRARIDAEGRASPCNDARGRHPAARDHSREPVRKLRRLGYQRHIGDLPPVLDAIAGVHVPVHGTNILVGLILVDLAGIEQSQTTTQATGNRCTDAVRPGVIGVQGYVATEAPIRAQQKTVIALRTSSVILGYIAELRTGNRQIQNTPIVDIACLGARAGCRQAVLSRDAVAGDILARDYLPLRPKRE